MQVDLLQVSTSDGVRLHGALELPAQDVSAARDETSPPRDLPVDVWLCIHGTGSNFYSASTLAGLAPKLLATGAAVLRGNTRGHDVVCTGPSAGGHSLLGAAFERVDEAPLDLQAWIELLRDRGFSRVGLLGHSLGAIKAILTLAAQDPPPIAALVAASPPRLSYEHFCQSRRGLEFVRNYEEAQRRVELGRAVELMLVQFPIAYYVTAAGFLDRYGPDEKYNILGMLQHVRVPTLVTYGSAEVQHHEAFQGMPEAVERCASADNRLQVAVVAGADHQYTACHDTLAAMIGKWVARI